MQGTSGTLTRAAWNDNLQLIFVTENSRAASRIFPSGKTEKCRVLWEKDFSVQELENEREDGFNPN